MYHEIGPPCRADTLENAVATSVDWDTRLAAEECSPYLGPVIPLLHLMHLHTCSGPEWEWTAWEDRAYFLLLQCRLHEDSEEDTLHEQEMKDTTYGAGNGCSYH